MGLTSLDRKLRTIALILAALAGAIDAMGFLMAGGYFVSFMSGNSTRLAVEAVSGFGQPLVAAGLIAGFISGVVLGELIGTRWSVTHRTSRVLGLVAALLGMAATLASSAGWIALLAMVLAMGAANMALPQTGPVRIGLTYMTGTLVRIGKGVADRLMGQSAPGLGADLGLWGALAVGALAGAGAFALWGPPALWGPAAIALLLALLAIPAKGGSTS
jgi:uncharacterized membrane protein YoaK (UPF0700 family)